MKSGCVSCKAGRYYVSVLVEEGEEQKKPHLNDLGLGIDSGIKEFAVMSNGTIKKNINKTEEVKKIEKKLKREQRSLSRKYENYKKRSKKKGEATRQNIQKQVIKVQRLYQRIDNIRTDYINQCVNEIVKTKPSYVTIEDLNVSGMMKNRHLSKVVASQNFYDLHKAKKQVQAKWN
jgi:putative transposase